jgi:hypothetical protein
MSSDSGNHLAHTQGDVVKVILAAAGYNFRRLLAWLRLLLSWLWIALNTASSDKNQPVAARLAFFTDDWFPSCRSSVEPSHISTRKHCSSLHSSSRGDNQFLVAAFDRFIMVSSREM